MAKNNKYKIFDQFDILIGELDCTIKKNCIKIKKTNIFKKLF